MNNSLRYLGIGVDAPVFDVEIPEINRTEVPDVINLSASDAAALIDAAGLIPVVIGTDEFVFRQMPLSGSSALVGNMVFIQTGVTDIMPDMTGWTRSQISTYQSLLDIEVDFSGQGILTRQSIRPGRAISAGDTLTVTLE
jgi:beta-lactam-binding protein with PASTA domain